MIEPTNQNRPYQKPIAVVAAIAVVLLFSASLAPTQFAVALGAENTTGAKSAHKERGFQVKEWQLLVKNM